MNIFSQFIKSFHSPKDLATYRFQGIGKTILYVFFLMFIVSIPIAAKTSLFITNTSTQFSETLATQVPEFEFKNGILYSDQTTPYIDQQNDFVFIMDSTGEITPSDLTDYKVGFALLQREAVFVDNEIMDTYSYRDFGNINLTKEQISEMINNIDELLPVLIPIFLFLMYLLFLAMKFIGITVLSVFGIILRNRAGVKLNFKQLWTLSVYAVTLPTVLFALLDSLNIIIPFSFGLYWIIAIAMLHLVIKQIPKPRLQNTNTELNSKDSNDTSELT